MGSSSRHTPRSLKIIAAAVVTGLLMDAMRKIVLRSTGSRASISRSPTESSCSNSPRRQTRHTTPGISPVATACWAGTAICAARLFGSGMAGESLNQQQPALLLCRGINGVHRFVQSIRLDQPGAGFLFDVENQNQVFLVEVPGNRRVMAAARPEQRATGEINDIAARGVIHVVELRAESGQIQIAQHRDFSLQLLPGYLCELIQGETLGQIPHYG